MLYALLECPNRRCGEQYEGYGHAADLREIDCELCGARLEAVAFAEAPPDERMPSPGSAKVGRQAA